MPKNLTVKQRKAVESLLTTWDITQAALLAGVSRDTLYRWLRAEEFRQALQDATRASLEGLSRGLVAMGTQAMEVLSAAMADTTAPAAAKVRAAEIVLTKILSLRELIDLEERITALERGR